MRIYRHDDLKNPIDKLDLGTVEAGSQKIYEFAVENDSIADLEDLVFSVDNSEVLIVSAPTNIKSMAIAKLVVEWSPSLTLKSGLKADLSVKGHEIYK